MRKIITIAGIIASTLSQSAYAELFSSSSLGEFKLSGFLSAAVASTNADFLPGGYVPYYVSKIEIDPSFDEDTNVGLQFTKYLRDDVNITVQLLAEAYYDFIVEASWAFIEYEPNNTWAFRAGRVRTSPYMLSQYVHIAYAYPWIRPPQEVYTQIPFSDYTGVDVKFRTTICDQDFSVYAFWGADTTEIQFQSGLFPSILDDIYLQLRHIVSFDVRYGTEVFMVRAGYETSVATFYPDGGTYLQGLNEFINGMIQLDLLGHDYVDYFTANHDRGSFMGVGYQFDWNNIVSMGELVRRRFTVPFIANPIGWYLMGGYRVKNIMPHITYARERLTDNDARRFNSSVNNIALQTFGYTLDNLAQFFTGTSYYNFGGAGNQTSVTLGVRWDIMDGVALKAEYSHVHPDKLSQGLFVLNPLKSVNVYSFAVNAVM